MKCVFSSKNFQEYRRKFRVEWFSLHVHVTDFSNIAVREVRGVKSLEAFIGFPTSFMQSELISFDVAKHDSKPILQ